MGFNVCEAISLEFLWAKSGGLCRGEHWTRREEGILKIYTEYPEPGYFSNEIPFEV